VSSNVLSYVSSYLPKVVIIGDLFEGTKTKVPFRNINEHCVFVLHTELKSFLKAKKDAN